MHWVDQNGTFQMLHLLIKVRLFVHMNDESKKRILACFLYSSGQNLQHELPKYFLQPRPDISLWSLWCQDSIGCKVVDQICCQYFSWDLVVIDVLKSWYFQTFWVISSFMFSFQFFEHRSNLTLYDVSSRCILQGHLIILLDSPILILT